jgi:hypothetical protein
VACRAGCAVPTASRWCQEAHRKQHSEPVSDVRERGPDRANARPVVHASRFESSARRVGGREKAAREDRSERTRTCVSEDRTGPTHARSFTRRA